MALPGLTQNLYSDSELDTLVGPIALYPDPVLSNVIRAATFPDQVMEASKASSNKSSWDASVSALYDSPTALNMLAENEDWMKSLGWASANQITDVMDAVQRYRYKSKQAGGLESNDKVTVISEGTTIRIESASPEVVYVPTYQPINYGAGIVWGTAVVASAYMWNHMYHWNTGCFYPHPHGYRPPGAYYRPYGWQNSGVYAGNSVRLNGGNNVVRGPVTVNNINVNRNNNINVNRNNINNVNSRNRNNVNNANRVQAQPRTSLPNNNRASTGQRPGLGSYSSAGSTTRQSQRGASSRGRSSVSSGSRSYSRGGGGRSGGRRR
jgi:Protein of unknown function (DUF3300)